MAADGESGSRRLGVAFRVAAAASFGAVVAAAVAVDRDGAVTWIAAALGRERPAGGVDDLVSPERFAVARAGAVLVAAVLSAALWWRAGAIVSRSSRLVAAAGDIRRAAAARFAALPALERWTWGLLLGGFALQRTVDALTVPLHPDEVTSFLALIRHGPLVAFTVYTSPNNHVLHSVLSSVAVALPVPTTFAIRLTAIVGSMAAVAALAVLLRTSGRAVPALLGMLTFAALPPVVYYGASGRGYGLVLAATALGIAATVQLGSTPARTASRRWR